MKDYDEIELAKDESGDWPVRIMAYLEGRTGLKFTYEEPNYGSREQHALFTSGTLEGLADGMRVMWRKEISELVKEAQCEWNRLIELGK